ncbi:hypothetical protein ALC60_08011 [Trachymyrmex zeteki]|uniref:Uncharacterized protein n=1 Tax=Mycetomoellerius zeteki TaxID=64791 RepID=A0A151WYF2_9HYME|nr:hypothetical protein ALC60_08011 [Trachymyrmex zeteki]
MHEYIARELLTQHRGAGGKPEVFGQGATTPTQYIVNLIKTKELNNSGKYIRRDWKTRFHRASTLRNFKEISRLFNSNNGQPDHSLFPGKIQEITSSDLANSKREKGFKPSRKWILPRSAFQSNSIDIPHFLNRSTK